MSRPAIRVVVAEDSLTVRELLVAVLESTPDIKVVGEAKNGAEAVELTTRLTPHLVLMDVNMPVMDGLEATKEIMARTPTPIVVVSSKVNDRAVELSLDALRAGALIVLEKPDNVRSERFAAQREQLLSMVRAMAEVKVVRRWGPSSPRVTPRGIPVLSTRRAPAAPVRLVAIAASTGGPAALRRILADLPRGFQPPVLIVQHIAKGFVSGLADWLGTNCDLRVKVAENGEALAPRTVYVAPDDAHLGAHRDGTVVLSDAPPVGGFRPSATRLFESVARSYGSSVAAVILTGMGSDGVDGLKAVHANGGRILAQDEATSVVYGMPQEAVRAGVVDAVHPIQDLALRLIDLVQDSPHAEAHSRR